MPGSPCSLRLGPHLQLASRTSRRLMRVIAALLATARSGLCVRGSKISACGLDVEQEEVQSLAV